MIKLPVAFKENIVAQLGAESHEMLDAISSTASPVSIRINSKKLKHLPKLEAVPWCKDAFYLPQRPLFTQDPLIHAGAYYVQEASSMLLDTVLRQILSEEPVKMLDVCAAPGGKSTLIASVLPEGSILVANEVIKSRSNILLEILQKWSADNTIVTSNDPSQLGKLTAFFDCILVDAPCSGEGLFRKDPESCNQWSEEAVHLCMQRQKRILADVWQALSEGGYLIYSTCTYNSSENEEIMQWVCETLGAEEIKIKVHPEWGFTQGNPYGLHAFPHKVKGEGFYIALLQKTATNHPSKYSNRFSKNLNQVPKEKISALKNILPNLLFSEYRNKIVAYTHDFKEVLSYLDQNLYIQEAGLSVGTFIHNELIPEHALALSNHLQVGTFPNILLSHKESLHYLRKDVLHPQSNTNGWHLVQFNGIGLGWMKQLQGRSNNAYPKNWRIQMEIKQVEEENLFSLGRFI